MKPKSNPFLRPALLTTAALGLISSIYAADGTWSADTTPLFWRAADTGNWASGVVADASGFTANFTNNITGDRVVNIDADKTITNIVFGDSDTTSAGSWTIANNGVSTNNLILAGTTPTITVNALGTGKTATISAIIEGSAGLTKAGSGTLTLTGVNTYTGGTTVNNGTLALGGPTGPTGTIRGTLTINSGAKVTLNVADVIGYSNAGSTSYVSQININGGTIDNAVSGNNAYTSNFTLTGGIMSSTGGGKFHFNTGYGITTLASANTSTISAGIELRNSNNMSYFVAEGAAASDLVVSGAIVGTGGGITKSGAGTMVLSGTNTYTGATAISAGTLKLDFSASGAPTTNIINNTANSSALAFSGGKLLVVGKDSTTNSQQFNGVSASGAGQIQFTSGTSGTLNASLGALTTTGVGTLDIVLPSSGTVSTTTTGANNGVLVYPYPSNWMNFMTVNNGATWASVSGGNIVPFTSYATANTFGTYQTHTDLTLDTSTGAATTGDIRFNVDGKTLTLTGALNVDAGGILVTPNAATSGATITGSTLYGNGGGKKLVIFNYGKLTIASQITDTANGIVFTGTGTTTLTGTNIYTGATTISAGTVKIGNATALGASTAAVSVANDAVLDLNGTVMTNTNALTINGTGIGSGGALTNSSATAGTYAGLLTLGSASSMIASAGNISLTNTGTITGSGLGLTVGGTYNTTISSIIGTGAGTLTKQDAGTLTLSGANTYTGATTVTGGTLKVQNSYASSGFTVAGGAVLELNGGWTGATTTFSGTGTLRKTGAGTSVWGAGVATFALGSGSLIDVQEGTFIGGSFGNEIWTSNLSDLNVAGGATFSTVEANVRVNKITGTGIIATGYTGCGLRKPHHRRGQRRQHLWRRDSECQRNRKSGQGWLGHDRPHRKQYLYRHDDDQRRHAELLRQQYHRGGDRQWRKRQLHGWHDCHQRQSQPDHEWRKRADDYQQRGLHESALQPGR